MNSFTLGFTTIFISFYYSFFNQMQLKQVYFRQMIQLFLISFYFADVCAFLLMFGRHHQNFIAFACQKINTEPVKHLTSDHSENLFVSFHNAYSYLKHGRYYLHKLDIVILILRGTVTLNKMRRQYKLIYLFRVINIKSSTILILATNYSDLIA